MGGGGCLDVDIRGGGGGICVCARQVFVCVWKNRLSKFCIAKILGVDVPFFGNIQANRSVLCKPTKALSVLLLHNVPLHPLFSLFAPYCLWTPPPSLYLAVLDSKNRIPNSQSFKADI